MRTAPPAHLPVPPPPAQRALPAGYAVRLDSGVRRYPHGDGGVVLGGAPLRVLRCNPPAWREVGALCRGAVVRSPEAGAVAGALLDAGLAQAVPDGAGPTPEEVTVIVPARDRPAALARCLAALGPAGEVIVVDDASERPDLLARVVSAASARLVRRERNGGPAAARNTGLAAARTPFVAFVDSDAVPAHDWLNLLLPQLGDPAVAVAAPRVLTTDGGGWLARYESGRSPLDLGDRPGPVRPRSRIGYVPAVALLARRAALGAGFNEDLRVGEDVDLIWRLHHAGWRVRYEPASRVHHAPRVRMADWAKQRFDYGTSAGPLARRHPGDVPPAVVSAVATVPLLLLRARRPTAAAVTVGVAALGLARQLPGFTGRGREALHLALAGSVSTIGGLLRATVRTWLPAALVLAPCSGTVRLALVGAAVGQPLAAWAARRPDQDPLRWTLAWLLDDSSYCAGVWVGAIRARTLAPLLPAVPELASWRQAGCPPLPALRRRRTGYLLGHHR